jgi:hypothetical protein
VATCDKTTVKNCEICANSDLSIFGGKTPKVLRCRGLEGEENRGVDGARTRNPRRDRAVL